MGGSEFVYQAVGVEKLNYAAFNTFVSDSGNSYYSDLCFYCTDIFGCVGLRRKKFAILNKTYPADVYEALVQRLVAHMKQTGEWGQFFPAACSPFAYNESVAHERYPLAREQAIASGYRWREEDVIPVQNKAISVPDDSLSATPDILQSVFVCPDTAKNFKIMPGELTFYKTNNLPIPCRSPNARYAARMRRRR